MSPLTKRPLKPVPRPGADALDHADHRAALRAYFARRLDAADEVDDHVQDVYCRVLAARLDGQRVANWRDMLMRVASSVWIDRFRRDKARVRDRHVAFDEAIEVSDGGATSPEAATAGRQKLAAVRAALLELDPVCRQSFVLARYEGMSHKEIAARLGIPTVAVGRHIERAMIHLARRVADQA